MRLCRREWSCWGTLRPVLRAPCSSPSVQPGSEAVVFLSDTSGPRPAHCRLGWARCSTNRALNHQWRRLKMHRGSFHLIWVGAGLTWPDPASTGSVSSGLPLDRHQAAGRAPLWSILPVAAGIEAGGQKLKAENKSLFPPVSLQRSTEELCPDIRASKQKTVSASRAPVKQKHKNFEDESASRVFSFPPIKKPVSFFTEGNEEQVFPLGFFSWRVYFSCRNSSVELASPFRRSV